MTSVAYVDASALVKLVVPESASVQMLRWYVEADRVVTSRVGVVETRRAAARRPYDRAHLRFVLDSIEVLEIDARIADRASGLDAALLRTLDAIHLASALELGSELDAFVTYDARLGDAARLLGLPVVTPG
jgi:hypothetical protein